MAAKSHFLSGVGVERREKLRREVRLKCGVFYLRNGLRGYAKRDAIMVNISEGGCQIKCLLPRQLPEHFYLIIEGIPFKFSCAIVNCDDEGLNAVFSQELPTDMVERLAANRFSRP